jgi:hypothetical protein
MWEEPLALLRPKLAANVMAEVETIRKIVTAADIKPE